MALPTGYTEATFKAWLHAELRDVASALSWTVDGGDYNEIVNEALFAYGADDIEAIAGRDNLRKLRALGRVELWRAVMSALAGDYDYRTESGASYSRSQAHAQAKANYEQALTEALPWSDAYEIGLTSVIYDDYYNPPDLDDDLYARAEEE